MARAGGVEREENYEPRRLDPPLSQTAATVGHVAAAGPLLVVPSLAGGDSVDGTALQFLLKQTQALKKKEDEEERRKVAAQQLEEKLEAEMKLLNDTVHHDLPAFGRGTGGVVELECQQSRDCWHFHQLFHQLRITERSALRDSVLENNLGHFDNLLAVSKILRTSTNWSTICGTWTSRISTGTKVSTKGSTVRCRTTLAAPAARPGWPAAHHPAVVVVLLLPSSSENQFTCGGHLGVRLPATPPRR